jgi:hypothetical protein
MHNVTIFSLVFLLFFGIFLLVFLSQEKSTITGFGVRDMPENPAISKAQSQEIQEDIILKDIRPLSEPEPAAAEATVDVSVTIIPSSKNE